MTSASIWFHEDDFGQREVLPVANLAWCQAEVWRSLEFGEAHAVRTEGRLTGFTDMYRRGTPPRPLATLAWPRETVARSLGACLPCIDVVTTGSASGPAEPCPRTHAFGGLLVTWNASGIVLHIGSRGPLLAGGTRELDALLALSSIQPLLFVDWIDAWALPLDPSMPGRDAFFDVASP